MVEPTQEIGVRVALGASNREILRLVLLDGLKPVAVGLVVGIVTALPLSSALERLVYAITPTDPMTFAVLPALLALVALVASLVPALRALRVDPMTALRVE